MSALKKYKRVKYLGKGSYGAAILVELKANPSQKFVIKEIVIGHLKPAEQESAKSEADVLRQMNHSNITTYVESFVENSKLYIVMEFADGGDLSSSIAARKEASNPWAEEELMRIFIQICLALKHIHAANILHRDLKSQNIFLTQKGMVKLGDFGIAKVLDATDDQARTQIGTPYYLSPEICESQPYGRESDIWSLGVLLYELCALEMPFQARSLPALVHRICSAEPDYKPVESKYSPKLVVALKTMLQKDPSKRPSVNELVRTDFLKGHISKLLSYTLKKGNGGVETINSRVGLGAMLPGAALDPEEVEKKIEILHEQAKQLQQIENQQAMESRREEEKEKLKRFRQEMKRKKDEQSEGSSPRSEASPRASPRNPYARGQGSERDLNGERKVAPAPLVMHGHGPRAVSPSVVIGVGKSLAEVRAERRRDGDFPSQHSHRGGEAVQAPSNPYQDAARREYFANRAAAQAVKARVEAYDGRGRGGVSKSYDPPPTYFDPPQQQAPPQENQQEYQPPVRRNSRADRGLLVMGGGAPYAEDVQDYSSGESRVAAVKAQRERERELQNAQKELELKQALAVNREERRRFDQKYRQPSPRHQEVVTEQVELQAKLEEAPKGKMAAIAFDIDVSDSSHQQKVSAPAVQRRRNSEERKAAQDSKKKGWGPPVVPNESNIARGRVYAAGAGLGAVGSAVVVPPTGSRDGASSADPGGEQADESSVSRRRLRKGPAGGVYKSHELMFEPSGEYDRPVRVQSGEGVAAGIDNEDDDGNSDQQLEGESEVLHLLAKKRASQIQAREQAKDVFRKLREKKKRESQDKGKRPGGKRVVEHSVVSPVKKSDALSPRRQRMMEVMSKVEQANASVQQAIEVSDKREAANRAAAPVEEADEESVGPFGGNVYVQAEQSLNSKDSKQQRDDDIKSVMELGGFADVPDEDDDLKSTLEDWFMQQVQGNGVTLRRGHQGVKDIPPPTDVQEDEGLDGYETLIAKHDYGVDEVEEEAGAAAFGTSDKIHGWLKQGTGPNGESYLGNDVEVVGLQCMLAEALMGDDDGYDGDEADDG